MSFNSGRMRLILNTLSIPILVSSLILVAGFSYQNSAGQNVPSGGVYQSPYELLPLPEIMVTFPVGQTSNASSGNTNDSFVYPSPTLHLVNVPEGIDSSCYNLTLYELVNKSTDLCYGLQVNEFLKHPSNQSHREELLKQPLPDEFFDKNMTSHFDQKYTLEFLKKSHDQQMRELFGKNIPSAMNNQTDSQCDISIYDDYVNPGPPRFFMLHPCITVTGNVSLVHDPAGGFDGDIVFALALDEPYQNLVTTTNFNSKMTGGIWVELICQYPNNATALVHKGDCSAGTSPKFFEPVVGDRVKVTGAYVIDIREGGHAEIHPVSSMSKIS
jgi:hypothetical protein